MVGRCRPTNDIPVTTSVTGMSLVGEFGAVRDEQVSLVALDLDGTILDEDYYLHPRTLAAIRSASKRAHIVLVTGRMWFQTERFADMIGGCSAVVCGQGSLVYGADGSLRRRYTVDADAAQVMLELARTRTWNVLLSIDGHAYSEELAPEVFDCVDLSPADVNVVADAIVPLKQLGSEKIVIVTPGADYTSLIRSEVGERLSDYAVSIKTSSPYLVEVTHWRATKGHALADLCEELDVSVDNVVAIGDTETDAEMFDVAGIGIAVETADPSVIARATRTCAPPELAGVADVLAGYGLFSPPPSDQ